MRKHLVDQGPLGIHYPIFARRHRSVSRSAGKRVSTLSSWASVSVGTATAATTEKNDSRWSPFFVRMGKTGWVQVWVWAFLLTANGAALYLAATTRHPLPGWAAVGFVFVVLTNMTIVLYERGISRLTSLPHLIPWVPLQVYAGYWLFARGDVLAQTPLIHAFAWFYFIVIGISNVFDAYDTVRWFRGERQVLGVGQGRAAHEPGR